MMDLSNKMLGPEGTVPEIMPCCGEHRAKRGWENLVIDGRSVGYECLACQKKFYYGGSDEYGGG